MRTLLLILASLPAFALSNAVTIHNLSAVPQSDRTWAIHRYFADKELCGQPQPFTGGSPIPYWQADVTSRWISDSECPAGYVKTAMISFELTVGGSSAAVVEFRTSANTCSVGDAAECAAAGASKNELYQFDAGGGPGSWGLKVSATTGGITLERSARAMIAADQYQILKNGPLLTEVLVREGPQSMQATATRASSIGWHCLTNCTAPYDAATWEDNPAWYSIRPTFLLRFYRRWKRVEGDSILQNAWLDRHVDQRLAAYSVLTGAGEATGCYTAPAAFVIPARSTVWDGPCWSTDPADSANTKIDLNPAYLVYSKAIPPHDPTKGVSATAIDLEQTTGAGSPTTVGWNNTDKGATTTAAIAPHMGWGQWQRSVSAGGNGHWISVLPRGSVRYLLSMDNAMLDIVMGGARAYLHAPFSYLDASTADFYTAGGPTAFGQPVSLAAHPMFTSRVDYSGVPDCDKPRGPGNTAPAMVSCHSGSAGTLTWCSNYAGDATNMWEMDVAHTVEPYYVPWLVTGKHFLTEAMWQQAAWASGHYTTANPMTDWVYERVGIVGHVYDAANAIRSLAWTMRVKLCAVVSTPDSFAVEKAYFRQMATGALALDEGRMGIVNGSVPPPDPTNADDRYGCPNKTSWLHTDSLWCIGRYLIDQGRANPVGFPHWIGYSTAPDYCRNCRQDITSGYANAWMTTYANNVYGWAVDLGFPAQAMFHKTAQWLIGLTFDSAHGGTSGSLAPSFHIPMRNGAGTGYLQSWTQVAAARIMTARVGRDFANNATVFRLANAMSASQSGQATNSTDLYAQTYMYANVGSEIVGLGSTVDKSVAMTVSPALDEGTVTGHTFQTGDLVRVHRIGPGGINQDSGPLSVADGGSMCLYGKFDCDFYLEAVSPTTLRFYLDSGRTHPVDWTASDSGLYVGQTEVTTSPYYLCWLRSGQLCRGLQGTTATAHSIGETFAISDSLMSASHDNPQRAEGAYWWSALAYAAEHGTFYTDSITGKPLSGAAAFERWQRIYSVSYQMGGGSNCTGLAIDSCDNPQFGYKPRGTPANVRLAGNNLLYTAPDGAACRYAVSSTPIVSTDDSGDTLSAAGPRVRSIPLASGTYFYRISCGAAGRVTGRATAP